MWQSAHHSNQHGNKECFDPNRGGHGHGHHPHHGGGWGGSDCDGPRFVFDHGRDPGWGGFDHGCHEPRFVDHGCHDGPRALISFDHNSILACH